MSISVFTPAAGVRVIGVSDGNERFKTAMLTVQMFLPLCEKTASEQAILPFLLRRGCAAYPDFSALKRRLDQLYGAEVSASVHRVGEAQAMSVRITCLQDRYALGGEQVAAQCAELLRGMIFEPPLEGGVFRDADIEEERRCLIENIRSEINNKRTFARAQAEKLLCEGEPFSVRVTGTAEEAEMLTAEQITAAWQRMLKTAQVQIIYQGDGDAAEVTRPFVDGFSAFDRQPAELPILRVTEFAMRESEESMAVAQSKMVIGMRCTLPADRQDTAALRMVNGLFGATAFSMLFRTVREKLSLCYYCSSSFDRLKGVGLIDSGVEVEKIPAARKEILRQFDLLKAGEFSDEDMENTRLFLQSQYRTIGDLQSTCAGFYGGQLPTLPVQTAEEAIEELAAVTRERIVAAANSLQPACEYRLMPNGEGGEADE